ncbi:MAG: glycosyltransferase family protein [Acidimicrobiia bacterium]
MAVADGSAPRFLLYSHDGCGLGHVRRSLNLAAALAAQTPGAAVLVATGVDDLEAFAVPTGVDVLKLPGFEKVANGCYVARRLTVAPAQMAALRSGLLAATIESFRPDVLVVDKHPLGVGGELRAALSALRAVGGRGVLGLRDVLDTPATVAAEWSDGHLHAVVRDLYDAVLVYGTPGLLDPVAEAGLPADVAARAHWCGHIAGVGGDYGAQLPLGNGHPRVLACAGGGEDGEHLLDAFATASRGAPWEAIAVTGPRARAGALAPREGLTVVPAVRELQRWLPQVDAVVCMGGYNTLVEVASTATPAVCIPRVRPRQEQLVRARAFARHGLIRLIEPPAAPHRLRRDIAAALAMPRSTVAARVAATLDLDGANRAARVLASLGAGGTDRARAAVCR